MDREIDPVVEQRLLEFLHEKAFATGICQRAVLNAIARRLQSHERAFNTVDAERIAHHTGLRERLFPAKKFR